MYENNKIIKVNMEIMIDDLYMQFKCLRLKTTTDYNTSVLNVLLGKKYKNYYLKYKRKRFINLSIFQKYY